MLKTKYERKKNVSLNQPASTVQWSKYRSFTHPVFTRTVIAGNTDKYNNPQSTPLKIEVFWLNTSSLAVHGSGLYSEILLDTNILFVKVGQIAKNDFRRTTFALLGISWFHTFSHQVILYYFHLLVKSYKKIVPFSLTYALKVTIFVFVALVKIKSCLEYVLL